MTCEFFASKYYPSPTFYPYYAAGTTGLTGIDAIIGHHDLSDARPRNTGRIPHMELRPRQGPQPEAHAKPVLGRRHGRQEKDNHRPGMGQRRLPLIRGRDGVGALPQSPQSSATPGGVAHVFGNRLFLAPSPMYAWERAGVRGKSIPTLHHRHLTWIHRRLRCPSLIDQLDAQKRRRRPRGRRRSIRR